MGNTSGKPHPRPRSKKHPLQYKGTDRPAPPGKPYLASELEQTPDVLTIKWDAPLRNGGAPISGYLVEHRRTGSPHWVRATPLMVQIPELTMSGLEPGWRYQFRVFAENIVGLSDPSELSEPLTVTLQRSAITAPRFTQELKDTTALENEKVEFVAHFIGQPAPKMCWFKDGFEIFSSRRTRILTENDRSILTIHQSAICDEGEIKCTATNKAGHVSTKCRLTLEAPPSIRLPRQYEDGLLFEIGELIRLKVSVVGLPPPLVFWTHNGESIQENERYEIDNSDRISTLRISEALRSDRGEYQIKAVNKLGTDITSFLVTVTDKPSPPGKAKVVMALGKSVTLSWNSPNDDGGCKIGNYIIEYYRLGWNVWLKAATSRQLTTMLGDLIEGSEYKFRVKAESPFGVSEPSEESDAIFIPDPKRGLLESTGARSKSQPREIVNQQAPIAAKRKKPRSHSSSRSEEESRESPIPPARIRSPPKTPDQLSPKPQRKETINPELFDRASIGRDLIYGSPEIRMKKVEPPKVEIDKSGRDLIYGSPEVKMKKTEPPKIEIEKVVAKEKSKSPEIKSRTPSPIISRSPSPKILKEYALKSDMKSPKLSRENSENLGGSTEFMMVLYPDTENDFDFENISVAPPLSLSAPELGTEPPQIDILRPFASSTELLHERAMIRFYQEALAEEEALKRKQDERRGSIIPKIQINNKDNQDIVGLERKHSLRRRLSAGGSIPQQVLWAQRRQSLRNSGDFSDLFETKLNKMPLTVEEKRQLMHTRQRSQSEEMEEEEFEKVRQRMAQNNEPKRRKRISVVEEEFWDEYESSEDERLRYEPKIREINVEEEDETYHPPRMMVMEHKKYEEPFEILTKPAKLPDANFVPKPILKKNGVESRKNSLVEALNKEEETSRSAEAVASVAGVAAASVLIPHTILQNREAEEAKVVIDHYGDIVKSYSTKRKSSIPESNPVREALRKAAAAQADIHKSDEEVEDAKKVNNNNVKINSFDERLRNLERKLETQPRSATPMFKKTEGTQVEMRGREEDVAERNKEQVAVRGREQSRFTKRDVSKSKSPRKARRSSPSPTPGKRKTSRPPSRSSSKTNARSSSLLRKPKMCEIMTQTSTSIEPADFHEKPLIREDELRTTARIKIRTTMDYTTDLAMFAVATWVFFFSNELYAIPILLVAGYRQLKDEAERWIPNWIKKRWNNRRHKK
ncbi:PREDICTED: titin [Nicrophorus vespilloides]|uniref:Titin n=1 Tax=Nicrophorus vespilloides TaxID=110193 RepID=A0ABM1N3B0_NICVS|nr:PREDICTED: titin [Nicrophorus vespilloides]